MKLRKSQIAALLLIAVALALGACMNSSDPGNTPDATIDPFSGAPTTTGQPVPQVKAARRTSKLRRSRISLPENRMVRGHPTARRSR